VIESRLKYRKREGKRKARERDFIVEEFHSPCGGRGEAWGSIDHLSSSP
jgi:hypothetical protein